MTNPRRRLAGPLGWIVATGASLVLAATCAMALSLWLALFPPDRTPGTSSARLREQGTGEGQGVLELTCWHNSGRFESLSVARSPRHGDPPAEWFENQPRPAALCPAWACGAALPWERGSRQWPPAAASESVIVRGFGWPLVVLWSSNGVVVSGRGPLIAPPNDGSVNIWRTPRWLHRACRIVTDRGAASYVPANIRWIGLGVNTAFFVPVWLGALVGLRVAWGRTIRWFRGPGRCRACGYDRAGLAAGAPCPECGERG